MLRFYVNRLTSPRPYWWRHVEEWNGYDQYRHCNYTINFAVKIIDAANKKTP